MIGNRRVLITGNSREYFATAGEGKLPTDLGMIDLATVAESEDGDEVLTHLGKPFRVVVPKATDFFNHGKRTGAPMTPKDIGTVISYTGMCTKDRVLDAGTGSGIAAIFFGGVAKQVVTCEAHKEFSKVAGKNVSDACLTNVDCRVCDVIDVKDGPFDIIHLDMQIEHRHVEHAYSLLRNGGYFASYTPFIEQTFVVMDSCTELFGENAVMCVECMERELTRGKRGTRPSTRVGHTGYLTFARKI